MKRTLNPSFPESMLQTARNAYDAVRRITQLPDAYFIRGDAKAFAALLRLKDVHKGPACPSSSATAPA
ncbi:hypothetical protein [Candidatus Villigracilis affinis]|uniref:hypothetical protein n=1 Tax=Candidatus Villigracilis affinis TaxID=3140682 RepID=UPI002A19BA86|nr:hypothetical protein [Anaerolineales bacterium]